MGLRPRGQRSEDELEHVRRRARERYARNSSPQRRRAYLRHLNAGKIRAARPATVEKYSPYPSRSKVDEMNLSPSL